MLNTKSNRYVVDAHVLVNIRIQRNSMEYTYYYYIYVRNRIEVHKVSMEKRHV